MDRNGSIVERKEVIRKRIWDRMEESRIATFPLPPHGRIPNFVGSADACARLASSDDFVRARVIKVNPDAPQTKCRERALRKGSTLVMATPRLRQGFLVLEGNSLDPREASTIAGAFRSGERVHPSSLPPVEVVVVGSVAVNHRDGTRLGKGHGYAELEWGILSHYGLVNPGVPILTSVHDLQLVEDSLPVEPFDIGVDETFTPSAALKSHTPPQKPRGIIWNYVTSELMDEVPLLKELRK